MKNFVVIGLLIGAVLSAAVQLLASTTLKGYDLSVLHIGNWIIAVVSILSYVIMQKQVNARPEAFVRGVYGGTLLKLFVLIVTFFIYVLANKETLHKPTLFVLMLFYAIYTIIEGALLSQKARSK